MRPDDPALRGVKASDAGRELAARPHAPAFDLADAYGIVGDYVRLVTPHTEGAPAAIYATLLGACGALIGRGPAWRFGNVDHHVRLFPLVIGPTGSGRKGTALALGVTLPLAHIDPLFAGSRVAHGLSSAEGLIAELRDAVPDREFGGKVVPGDPGVTDKRLLVKEGEIGGAFEAMSREGNRLSAIIRDAWDGVDLRSMVKRDPQRATAPHLVVVGAITAAELRGLLSKAAVANGLANRFLPIWGVRARLLAEDSEPDAAELDHVLSTLAARIDRARTIARGAWMPEAAEQWRTEYERLSLVADPSDTIRALCERGAPYVRRIAFLLALLDNTGKVGVGHLNAALALWRYSAATWRHVYYDGSEFSALADKLSAALQVAGAAGLTRSQIREDVVRSNSMDAARIDAALAELSNAGLAIRSSEPTDGRPRERWRHARYTGVTPPEERDLRDESTGEAALPPLNPFPLTSGSVPEGVAGDDLDAGYWDSLDSEAA